MGDGPAVKREALSGYQPALPSEERREDGRVRGPDGRLQGRPRHNEGLRRMTTFVVSTDRREGILKNGVVPFLFISQVSGELAQQLALRTPAAACEEYLQKDNHLLRFDRH
ncbi:hypothetical protein CRENBAI_012044 [Crenichthys baileyi]|uniref:Uncharacterized protein n=1 Tax=Crenichthys baileyi TaxID=28760 RepID=A0AAV9QR67_9TELE